MNALLLCTLFLFGGQDPDPAAEARRWIERLDAAPQDAVPALVELGSEASAAPLVDVIRSAPPATGWHAAEALRGLGAAADKRDKALESAADALSAIVLDPGAAAESRELAALAFGSIARSARSKDVCTEILGGDHALRLRIAFSAALGGADKDTAKAIQKCMKRRPFFAGTLALAALGAVGEEASGAKAELVKLIGEDESLHSFLLLPTTRFALEEIGLPAKAWKKPWSKREKKESRRRWSGGKGGLNVGGISPRAPDAALSFLLVQSGFGAEFPAAKMSLPDMFEAGPNPSYFSVANMLQGLSLHVATEIGALADGLPGQEWKSWDAWVAHTEPLVMTAEYLVAFELRFLPDPK